MPSFFSSFATVILFCIFFSGDNMSHAELITYSSRDSQGVPFDRKLVEIMEIKNGIFIEAGAYDGIIQSNTKLLEECYGWTGILIEPSKNTFVELCKNRPSAICIECALGAFDEDNTYMWGDFDSGPMSSINGSRLNQNADQKVFVRSLQSILDELEIIHINFFSLDVEGYELNALLGIDFNKTTFDYLLIEIQNEQFDDIVRLMKNNQYELIENFSNYNTNVNVNWDGTHNDYLFKRKNL